MGCGVIQGSREGKAGVVFKAQHRHDECVRVILQIRRGAQCSLHRAAGFTLVCTSAKAIFFNKPLT